MEHCNNFQVMCLPLNLCESVRLSICGSTLNNWFILLKKTPKCTVTGRPAVEHLVPHTSNYLLAPCLMNTSPRVREFEGICGLTSYYTGSYNVMVHEYIINCYLKNISVTYLHDTLL